jgi:N-acetylglucosamine-6-phosphate deacetylase
MFITDGHHVPGDFVSVAWRAKGRDGFIVTSDVAPIAGLPPGEYETWGMAVVSEPGGRIALRAGGSLAGSSATMADCMRWLRGVVPLSDADALRVGRTNALRLLAW